MTAPAPVCADGRDAASDGHADRGRGASFNKARRLTPSRFRVASELPSRVSDLVAAPQQHEPLLEHVRARGWLCNETIITVSFASRLKKSRRDRMVSSLIPRSCYSIKNLATWAADLGSRTIQRSRC